MRFDKDMKTIGIGLKAPVSQKLVKQLVLELGVGIAIRPPAKKLPVGFDPDRVHFWSRTRIPSGSAQRAVMKFAAWLWKTGTHDMDLLIDMLEEVLRKNPDSWYAYFAPGGESRACRTSQAGIARSEAESEANKAAERAFLGVKR